MERASGMSVDFFGMDFIDLFGLKEKAHYCGVRPSNQVTKKEIFQLRHFFIDYFNYGYNFNSNLFLYPLVTYCLVHFCKTSIFWILSDILLLKLLCMEHFG